METPSEPTKLAQLALAFSGVTDGTIRTPSEFLLILGRMGHLSDTRQLKCEMVLLD